MDDFQLETEQNGKMRHGGKMASTYAIQCYRYNFSTSSGKIPQKPLSEMILPWNKIVKEIWLAAIVSFNTKDNKDGLVHP